MQIKEGGFTEHFYLRKGENVYSFFTSSCLDLTPVNYRARKKKRAHVHF